MNYIDDLRHRSIGELTTIALYAGTPSDRLQAAELLHARVVEREVSGHPWTRVERADLKNFVRDVRLNRGQFCNRFA